MKKIIALNGSPREQGSTAALVDAVLKAAGQQGAEVKSYYLNGMKIRGCQACYACKAEGRCVLNDDMQQLYGEIAGADGIIFASPVYMWQVTAQLKAAVDRLFPFLKRDYSSYLTPGKKVLLAVTQGQPNPDMFRDYFAGMGKMLSFLGFGEHKILIAGGTSKPDDFLKQAETVAAAGRMGAWIAE
jgi:multimeric flavodoxin WrbA